MSKSIRLLSLSFILFFLMLMMLIFPKICIDGATFGLILWFEKVLPSLLPFIILTQMLASSGILLNLSKPLNRFSLKFFRVEGCGFLIFILGLIGGYPTGAKTIGHLLQEKQISKHTAQKCLFFSNNCGPIFIIGTVGSILLKDISLGYFLMAIHILSAFTMLFISRWTEPSHHTSSTSFNTYTSKNSFLKVFNESIKQGMDIIVYVGGYIIFFSVLSYLLKAFIPMAPSTMTGILFGMIEFSSGVAMATANQPITPMLLSVLSFILGFGGLCVFFQTSYVLENTSLNLFTHLMAKLFQGILAFLYTLLFYPIIFKYQYGPLVVSPSMILIGLIFLLFNMRLLLKYKKPA